MMSMVGCGPREADDNSVVVADTKAAPAESVPPIGADDNEVSASSEFAEVSTTARADLPATRVGPVKDVLTRSPDAEGDGVVPEGFGTATVRITAADGDVCDVCLWLADEDTERQRGLMNVTDLDGPLGMAFAWNTATAGNFYMFGTPTPLSIAWFAPDGAHVGETDMAPCLDETGTDCERYGPGAAYDLAIEMFQGQLDKVGIGPGSTAEIVALADPANPTVCPLVG